MSLKIYFEGVDAIPDCTFEKDVEFLFRSIRLDGCEYDKEVIESIEKSKYIEVSIWMTLVLLIDLGTRFPIPV